MTLKTTRTEQDCYYCASLMPDCDVHKTHGKVLLANLRQTQIEMINYYYPRMDAETKRRADKTLKWLRRSVNG